MTDTPKGCVRAARDSDIPIIEAWLPKDASIDSLAVNWELSKRVYREEGMLVWEEAATGAPLAYFWGSLNSTSSILDVHPGRRREGIARAFVEYLIESARHDAEPLLKIECAPESSEAFWVAMGFTVHQEDRRLIGRRVIRLPQNMPFGEQVSVKVKFLSETALYNEGDERFISEHLLTGVQDETGIILLCEGVACFELTSDYDLAVQVDVAGNTIYRGKAKYAQADDLGIKSCMNGFLVRAINFKKV